LLIQIWNPK